MRKLLILFASVFLFASTSRLNAQEDSLPGVSDFVPEIMQVRDDHGKIFMTLWMPWQYWETAMLSTTNGKPLPQDVRDMISAMKQYNIFGIVDAKATPYGVVYADEKNIRDSIALNVGDSVKLKPVAEEDLPENVRLLVSLLKPTMRQMLGNMGNNLAFVVFPNVDSKNNYYIDAKNPGQFTLQWRSDVPFSWRLPLDVLTPPKYCPMDNEKLSGKYHYCPYHGNKLESQPTHPKK